MEIEGEANRMIQVCLERRGVSKKQKGVFRKHHGVSGNHYSVSRKQKGVPRKLLTRWRRWRTRPTM